MPLRIFVVFVVGCVLSLTVAGARGESAPTDLKFQFGKVASAPAGYTAVSAEDGYDKTRGYGFEAQSRVTALERSVTSSEPIYFSAQVPEGNYRVTVTLGGADFASDTTVKAELRRLMLQEVKTAAGESVTRTFVVSVRTPMISTVGHVRLKAPRETVQEAWAWDDKLTLEFTGPHVSVESVEIARADDLPTIFIIGDSTSTDQSREPYNSWGQMLTRFFTPEVVIANHGESGETTSSFIGENRWAKVLSVIKPGDWVIMQFGHNDMKDRGPNAGAYKNYKTNLVRFVTEARAHGAKAVLVTPMNRRTFEGTTIVNSFGDYPDAVRQTAKELDTPLIDLNLMSKTLYEALGPAQSGVLFAGKDTTHHSDYGSYELARCIVEGIRQNKLEIAKYLSSDMPAFDPAKPDAFTDFKVPAEPMQATTTRPAGS